eukprot:maker-scaffold_20-snap-gene-5.13-mRNA-1 protein AED:0.05 eAED:0.05 QI:44/1/1/1/1/1/8/16/437
MENVEEKGNDTLNQLGIDEEELKESIVDNEYIVWKKNAPFLYDLVKTTQLDWPSLTCEWFSKKVELPNKGFHEQRLLLGTNTSGQEQNSLLIANIKLPNHDASVDVRLYDEEKGELGSYGDQSSKFEIQVKINHDGEINRARIMPQNELIIASKTIEGPVYVFDISKCPSVPEDDLCKPQVKLKGHEGEGYGLDWNKIRKGRLVSGADDCKICLFDLESTSNHLVSGFKAHQQSVGDCRFHPRDENVFGSVSDDSTFKIWDSRDLGDSPAAVKSAEAHENGANCFSFNPFKDTLFLTAGGDSLVKLWDMRKMRKPLHTFVGHRNGIMQLEWSPFDMAKFATCAEDRRVIVWDAGKIGDEQSPEDAASGPPELMFTHGGHSAEVKDFGWNKNEEYVMASVSEDNVLQIWQPSDSLCYQEDLRTIVNGYNVDDFKEKKQ